MAQNKWEPKKPQKMSLDEVIRTASLFGVKVGDRYQDHWRNVGMPDNIAVGIEKYFTCSVDYGDVTIIFTTKKNQILFNAFICEFFVYDSPVRAFLKTVKAFDGNSIVAGEIKGGSDFADVVRFLEENHIQFAECPPIIEDWSHVLYTENGLEILFFPVGKRSRLAIITLQGHRKEFERLRKISE